MIGDMISHQPFVQHAAQIEDADRFNSIMALRCAYTP